MTSPAPSAARPPRGSERAWLLGACLLALVLRLGTAPQVFAGDPVGRDPVGTEEARHGGVLLDGTDGYYHLRRAWLTLADWPRVPQRDAFLGPPDGGLISWPPLFDWALAALAKVYPAAPEEALEAVGARLPVLLGIAQVLVAAALARRLAGRKAAVVAALLVAALPAAVRYTLLGALDHDPAVELLAMLALLVLAGALSLAREGRQVGRSAGNGAQSAPYGDEERYPGVREGRRVPRTGADPAVIEAAAPDGASATDAQGLGERLAGGPRWRWALRTLLAAAALAALPLTWAGSEVHLALVALALLGAAIGGGWRAAAPAGVVLSVASLVAAAVVTPFAARSVWSGLEAGAFAGLSRLHVAALLGLAVWGALVALLGREALDAQPRRAAAATGALAALALAALLPSTLAPLAAGARFVGGSDSFLAVVAESRPLLRLFGSLDSRPAMVRLSFLPLVVPLLLAWFRPRRDAALGFAAVWAAGALALALLQARYSHGAALALAVLAGVVWQRLPSRAPRPRALLVAALLPCLAAYLPLPGFGGLRLYGRPADLVTTGMAEVTAFLAAAAPPPPAWSDAGGEASGAVLAPWSFGHWIHWRARRPTVANPFGPYGQTGFADGVRFWLLDDPRAAADLLARHRVRWVVAPTAPQPPWELAALVGDDARPWRQDVESGNGARFAQTMGARLAWTPGAPFLREVYRTRASRRLADGSLEPLLRVYEVVPAVVTR